MNSPTLATPLSEATYAECFESYKKTSGEWDAMLRWIQGTLLASLPRKDHLSILSVGSGTGDFDLRFARTLKRTIRSIDYSAIDPNLVHCRQFESGIKADRFDGIRFEIHPVRFEDFHTDRRFDLVLLAHCLYYIPDREGAILGALESIRDDGRVLVFHQTPVGIHQIQRAFMGRVKGSQAEMFSSHEIQEILDRRHIAYHLEVVDSVLDVSDYCDGDSEPAQKLLSFFLESDVRQLRPTIRREIHDYVRGLAFENRGRRLIRHPVAVFSLFKNALAG